MSFFFLCAVLATAELEQGSTVVEATGTLRELRSTRRSTQGQDGPGKHYRKVGAVEPTELVGEDTGPEDPEEALAELALEHEQLHAEDAAEAEEVEEVQDAEDAEEVLAELDVEHANPNAAAKEAQAVIAEQNALRAKQKAKTAEHATTGQAFSSAMANFGKADGKPVDPGAVLNTAAKFEHGGLGKKAWTPKVPGKPNGTTVAGRWPHVAVSKPGGKPGGNTRGGPALNIHSAKLPPAKPASATEKTKPKSIAPVSVSAKRPGSVPTDETEADRAARIIADTTASRKMAANQEAKATAWAERLSKFQRPVSSDGKQAVIAKAAKGKEWKARTSLWQGSQVNGRK